MKYVSHSVEKSFRERDNGEKGIQGYTIFTESNKTVFEYRQPSLFVVLVFAVLTIRRLKKLE